MRSLCLVLGTGLVALAALPAVTAAQQAEEPQRGGILNFAVSAEPPNYDCHANTSFAFIHPVRPHYNTLLRFVPDGYPEVEGDLAASWDIADDGLTYTFHLEEGVTFHDGTPFTAADVKASYERIVNPPEGVISIRQAAYADIESIETPDERTVVFTLSAPNAAMLQNFASPWDCIYSAEKLAEDPRFPQTNIMGTGPFVFGEHVAGSHWTGTRFENYWDEGKPYLDGFRAVFIAGAPMVNALAASEVLAEFRGHAPADRDRLMQQLGERAVMQESPWTCNLIVALNVNHPPFDDARVRRALSLAIDRWGGAEALSRIALVRHVGGVLRPGYDLAASDEELEKMPGFSRDIEAAREEAKRLLAEAGAENLSFTFTNRNVAMPYTPVGVFLIDQWRQIGVTVEHEQLETRLYTEKLLSDELQAGLDYACDFMDEPSIQLIKYISADKSTINYTGSMDEKLDQLYEQQARELDQEERYRIIREFEQHLLTEAYQFPTIWWHRIIVHHDTVKNWHITPSHYLNQDLAEVWLDQSQ
jgi:peptide/nickel transport system substrate-binding protein